MTINTHYLPIYNNFSQNTDWEPFKSQPDDFTTPLSKRPVDFSLRDAQYGSFWVTAQQIITLVAKVILFPWGVYCLARYTVQRMVMILLYPLQSRIVRISAPYLSTSSLNLHRQSEAKKLSNKGFIVRDVSLEKNGVCYSGMLIGHQDTITNGRWALQATGNGEPVEHSADQFAMIYKKMQTNILVINGPAVARSEGQAHPESIGDAQQVGISFLETALEANEIVMAGRSLGGAAIGQAILQHDFKKGIKYVAIRQMSFDRASNIAVKFVDKVFNIESLLIMAIGSLINKLPGSPNGTRICGPFIHTIFSRVVLPLIPKVIIWSGCELDSVAASRKLEKLGIQEVIIQSTHRVIPNGELPSVDDFVSDGPIAAEGSLGYRLIHEKVTDNKIFLGLPYADHMTSEAISGTEDIIIAMPSMPAF